MRVRCGIAGLRDRVLLTVGGCDVVVDVGVLSPRAMSQCVDARCMRMAICRLYGSAPRMCSLVPLCNHLVILMFGFLRQPTHASSTHVLACRPSFAWRTPMALA